MAGRKPGIARDHSTAIRVISLSKSIAGKQVLHGVSLDVPAGTAMAVCGPNGAGKTTLIRIFMGLIHGDTGAVHMSAPAAHRSFLFHSPCLFQDLTLRQNCRFFLACRGQPFEEDRFSALVVQFGLEKVMSARVGTYSRGMRQKADLIRTLLEDSEVMFLDEPTSHLDPLGKAMVREILRSRVDSGMTLVLTSHLMGEVEKLADRVCLLHRGKVIWQGEPRADQDGVDLETRFIERVSAARGTAQ